MQCHSRLLTFLLAIVISACKEDTTYSDVNAELDLQPVAVQTMTLMPQPWKYTVETYGTLIAAENVAIGVESAGVVKQWSLVEGQQIEQGDLLFSLDSTKQKQRVNQIRAQVQESKSELIQARDSLTRKRKLVSEALISETQLQEAETTFQAASARLSQSQAQLALAKTELAEREIYSPVSGLIEYEAIEVGQYVQPGEVLLRIQATGSLQAQAYVNENEITQLSVGHRGTAHTAGFEFAAIVESIGSSANPNTGNYQVKLRLNGDQGHLREGMAVKVELPVARNLMTLQIPRTAVVDYNRHRTVFVVSNDKAISRKVSLGMQTVDNVLVTSGIQAGEKIILSPLEQITDGTEIVETQASMVPLDSASSERMQ